LSCAICYEFYSRGSAVSLMCGHSFCEACFKNWEGKIEIILISGSRSPARHALTIFMNNSAKHLENFKMSTIQGAYTGPDCPECRTTDVRRGRVRIWAMEETVRLVEKGAREMEDKMYIPGESIVDLDQSEDEEMHNEGEAMVV
jgi:ribosomal protein L37AE/L43A